jgi:glycosyltransferase involved in cell wall biosynthesis
MQRLLTVFLPTYNGLPHLVQTLASLQAQTYKDFELVVLDDCSSDGTLELVERFADPRLKLIRADRNGGLGSNWNRALELVETPYFAICHQDDLYEPRFLEVMLELLVAHPKAFIAHCKVWSIDELGRRFVCPAELYKENYWPPVDPYERFGRAELEVLRRGAYIQTSTVLYRTMAVRQIGFFRSDLQQSIDWDFWLRGVLAGFSILGTHRKLASYRRHPGMTTRRTEADLTRYREEISLLRWIAETAYQRGLADSPRPDYRIATNTLLSELARRLTGSEVASARTLLSFAEQQIPGFAGSVKHRSAQAACALGRWGGFSLRIAELGYLLFLALRCRSMTRLARVWTPKQKAVSEDVRNRDLPDQPWSPRPAAARAGADQGLHLRPAADERRDLP